MQEDDGQEKECAMQEDDGQEKVKQMPKAGV